MQPIQRKNVASLISQNLTIPNFSPSVTHFLVYISNVKNYCH